MPLWQHTAGGADGGSHYQWEVQTMQPPRPPLLCKAPPLLPLWNQVQLARVGLLLQLILHRQMRSLHRMGSLAMFSFRVVSK